MQYNFKRLNDMDPHHQPFFYTHYCYPEFTKYPLHSAVYNGRLTKFQSLLTSSEHSVYQVACDVRDKYTNTALFIAIARRHENIAHLILDIIADDLHALELYFQAIAPPKIGQSRFWLRDRILIAFGQDHIDYVLSESKDVRADPTEMGDRHGILVLLKPDNDTCAGVVWLSARHADADRIIARIVGHIYERGGELSLARRERWDYSLFGVAARMDQSTVWQRMFDMFGHKLERRELAISFRYFAQHESTAAEKTQRFDKLCQTFGGFNVDDIYSGGDEVNILYDAIYQFTDDITILDHLISKAATPTKTTTAVVNQVANDRGCDRSLFNIAFQLEDKKLPWELVKYKPDLIACSTEWWDTPVDRFIASRPFDQRVHELILKNLGSMGRLDGHQWNLLSSLIRKNWVDTVRDIYTLDSSYRKVIFNDRTEGLDLLKMCSQNRAYDVLEYLISQHDLDASEKFDLMLYILGQEHLQFPDSLLSMLCVYKDSQFADLLCLSLQNRNLDIFNKLLKMEPNCLLKDVINNKKENLLFSSIWDNAKVRSTDFDYLDYESLEIIDSEDDDESKAIKTELNRQRTPPEYYWKDVIDENIELEQKYQQLFDDLLEAGANWRQVNEAGQNLVHIAVERNNISALRKLMDLGIDTSVSDANGNKPMHLVVSEEIFELLPSDDVRCMNTASNTPLLSYLNSSRPYDMNEQLITRFIEAGTDVRQADSNGNTALHLVRSAKVMQMLLDANVNVNAQNVDGNTPTHILFQTHRETPITLLVLLFAHPEHDVFLKNVKGESLLMHLVELNESDFSELRKLIGEDKLANLISDHCNSVADDGSSILQAYSEQDEAINLHCLQALLETPHLNADPRSFDMKMCADDEGRWLLTCAAHISQRSNKDVLDWTQCLAEGGGYLAQLRMFISAGIDTEITNRIGETPLQYYGWLGDLEYRDCTRIVAQLLEAGANYRLLTTDGVRALNGTVFQSLYEWDEEKGEGIQQQVFQAKFIQLWD